VPRGIEGLHIKDETAEPGDGLAVSHLQIRETGVRGMGVCPYLSLLI